MKTASQIIQDGIDYMMSHGWAQGKFGMTYKGTPACMQGSIGVRRSGLNHLPIEEQEAVKRADKFLGQAIKDYELLVNNRTVMPYVPMWNDKPERNFNEVIEVMERGKKFALEDESA